MTCPRCHAESRDGLRFCEDCGSRLTLACSQCGGELAPGKRFCGSCGAPATGQSAARTASPESYTSKHLAEKILTSKAALEGERKQVTVLFADLKGSMELLADRDPEEARKLLDPVLELGQLRTAEFLYETTLFPDLEYTFKHALTHEVAYGSLLQERRRLLHAQIVDAIERVYADRLTEQIERLAHHAIRGAQWQKALRYLREAGTKAVTRSAYREAVAFWEEALRVVPHLPEARETLEHAIDIRFALRHAVFQVEGLPSLLNHLLEAERLANTLGDKRRLGWAYDYLSNYQYNSGNHAEAAAIATRALAIASDLGDFGLTLAATYHLGNANYYGGRYHEAVELFQCCLQSLEKRPDAERYGLAVPPSILVRDWLALSFAELGEFSEGVRLTEEAVRIARNTARELDLTYAFWVNGDVYLRQGDFERASMALEEGLARCRAAFPGLLHNLAGPLGRAYVLSDRVVDAIPLLTEALACATSGGVIGRHSRLTTYLAEGYLHAHRAVEAREAALRALHLARGHEERGDEAWALNLLGEIAALANPPDVPTAEAQYGEAMALAAELGMRPLVAHCHLGLGKLYRRTGDLVKAEEHLATAATMYREMGMTFWLEKADAALSGVER
jgi:tetratricopeptide (TPR) repeat protein